MDSVAELLLGLDSTGIPDSNTKTKPIIYNFSNVVLNQHEINLLTKGFKFAPTRSACNHTEFTADTINLSYQIKRKLNKVSLNNGQRDNLNLLTAPPRIAPGKCVIENVAHVLDTITSLKPKKQTNIQHNIPNDEFQVIDKLKLNTDIVIKEADKGSAVVIMNKTDYKATIYDMLNDTITYEKTNQNIDLNDIVQLVTKFCNQWKNVLSKEETDIIIKYPSDIAQIYGLPKLHKSKILIKYLEESQHTNNCVYTGPYPNDMKFRPIISCRSCPTKQLCALLDRILRPFLTFVKFRIQDNWEFLRRCPNQVAEDTYAITADITSLYTNITTTSGIDAINYYYDNYKSRTNLPHRITKTFVIELYKFCQGNLFFSFDEIIFRQNSGTGMGKDFAPALADLKIGLDEIKLEEYVRQSFDIEVSKFFLSHYRRYLDDVIFLWRQSFKNLDKIKTFMNSIDPKIQYTFESSLDNLNSIPFLDVLITFTNGKLDTDIYSKPTDTYNYVPFNSNHPRHTIRNIPFVLARRIKGIVSDPNKLQGRFQDMTERLKYKKYPTQLIKGSIERAMSLKREDIIKAKPENPDVTKQNTIFFTHTHNNAITNPSIQVKDLTTTINQLLPNTDPKFTLLCGNRRSPNLRSLLMFDQNSQPKVKHCRKGCVFCPYLHEGCKLTLKTGVTLKTNRNFTCGSRNLVYIIVGKQCREFYIGETGDMLKNRFAVHRSQGKADATFVPVRADQHLRICDNNKYIVFPFYQPPRDDFVLRKQHEVKYIRLLKPKLNSL